MSRTSSHPQLSTGVRMGLDSRFSVHRPSCASARSATSTRFRWCGACCTEISAGCSILNSAVPSECADRLERGTADIGIVPAVEVPRLGLEIIRGAGIACREAVRSILLVSKVPFEDIRLLAADTNSRTSVQLARILLARHHGATAASSAARARPCGHARGGRRSAHHRRPGSARGHRQAALLLVRSGRGVDRIDGPAHGLRRVGRTQGMRDSGARRSRSSPPAASAWSTWTTSSAPSPSAAASLRLSFANT